MKTEISSYRNPNYSPRSPLQPDGRLMVDSQADAWLEPGDFAVVCDRADKLTVEADIPAKSCRFLGRSDGQAPACYFEANGGQPNYMESAPDGFAPELVCLHCQLYPGGREERRHDRSTRPNGHGILEELPELSGDEAGEFTPHIARPTGLIVG